MPFESVALRLWAGTAAHQQVEKTLPDEDRLRRLTAICWITQSNIPRGGDVLRIPAANKEKAVLTVHNTGEPDPRGQIPLFERFYRVDGSAHGRREAASTFRSRRSIDL